MTPLLNETDGAELHAYITIYARSLGARLPEDIAQETLCRVLANLGEGLVIRDLHAYARSVAHRVFLESLRQDRAMVLLADPPDPAPQFWSGDTTPDDVDDCLLSCLGRLEAQERELLDAYYSGRGRDRIARREAYAAKLGITIGALRARVFQVRRELRHCVEGCLRRKKS